MTAKYPYISIKERHPVAVAPTAPPRGIDEHPPPYIEAIYTDADAVNGVGGEAGRPMTMRAGERLSFDQRLSLLKPSHRQRWHFRAALLQLILGILTLTSASVCFKFSIPSVFMPQYAGFWVGALGMTSSFIAISAAIRDNHNASIAAVASHILAAISAVILGSLALSYAVSIGHTSQSRMVLPCLLPNYEPVHIKWIYENSSKLLMAGCLSELKIGFMTLTAMLLLGGFQALISVICLLLVLHRLCNCGPAGCGDFCREAS